MPCASKGGKRADHHDGLVDRDVSGFLEPAREPTNRVAFAAGRVAERDERRQLERLPKVELADVARLKLGDDQVAALDRSAEGGARVALGCDGARLRPGAGRVRAYFPLK